MTTLREAHPGRHGDCPITNGHMHVVPPAPVHACPPPPASKPPKLMPDQQSIRSFLRGPDARAAVRDALVGHGFAGRSWEVSGTVLDFLRALVAR